ncbi:MAG: hypothetical protein NT076_05265 [Candidatus Pacearchaeota archaeon]|nr:hypothetical protein [Candidatus Pacearchaeota archaeon]
MTEEREDDIGTSIIVYFDNGIFNLAYNPITSRANHNTILASLAGSEIRLSHFGDIEDHEPVHDLLLADKTQFSKCLNSLKKALRLAA